MMLTFLQWEWSKLFETYPDGCSTDSALFFPGRPANSILIYLITPAAKVKDQDFKLHPSNNIGVAKTIKLHPQHGVSLDQHANQARKLIGLRYINFQTLIYIFLRGMACRSAVLRYAGTNTATPS